MGDFCTCSLRLNQLITPVWKHFPHLETSGNLHFTMATITLRQEGGSHNFQERQITVENKSVMVGRSSESKKPHPGNATFSTLGIAGEQAVLSWEDYTRWFYLKNLDVSTGCTLNDEDVGFDDMVEIINADRVEFGGLSGIETVRAIIMLELDAGVGKSLQRLGQVEPEIKIKSKSFLWLAQEAEWKRLMRREDMRWMAEKEQEKKQKEKKEKDRE